MATTAKPESRSPPARRHRTRQSLSGEAVVLSLGAVAAQILTVLSLAVLARLLTKSQFGTYQQLGLVFSIVSSLLIAGVPSALLYFLPRASSDAERRRWVFDTYLVMGTLGAIGAVGLVVLRRPLADAVGNPGLVEPLAFYAPVLLFAPIGGAATAALVGQGRSRLSAVLNPLNAAALSSGTIVAAIVSPTARLALHRRLRSRKLPRGDSSGMAFRSL